MKVRCTIIALVVGSLLATSVVMAASTYANVVVVAKTGGDYDGDYDNLPAALDSITDSSATNRYLIKIMPGTYDHESLPDYATPGGVNKYVDIEGSGQETTVIKGALFFHEGEINIRNLTLKHETGTTYESTPRYPLHVRTGFFNQSGSISTYNVDNATIIARSNNFNNRAGAIFVQNDGPNAASINLNLTNVQIISEGGGGYYPPLFLYGPRTTLNYNGGSTTVTGINRAAVSVKGTGTARISNVNFDVAGNNYGGIVAEDGGTISIYNSIVKASNYPLKSSVNTTGTINAMGTQIIGGNGDYGPGVVKLVNCVDGTFIPIANKQ